MPTQIYRTRDGRRVPSVTTVIGGCQHCGGLVRAANNLGLDGVDTRDEWGAKATAGTVAHAWVQDYLSARDPTPYPGLNPDIRAAAEQAYQAWLAWWADQRIQIHGTEAALVHDEYEFGGCPDAWGLDQDGRICLLDWKTGKYRTDHLIQLAGYVLLLRHGLGFEVDGGVHLGSFSRTAPVEFSHHYWQRVPYAATRAFLSMLDVYRARRDLEGKR